MADIAGQIGRGRLNRTPAPTDGVSQAFTDQMQVGRGRLTPAPPAPTTPAEPEGLTPGPPPVETGGLTPGTGTFPTFDPTEFLNNIPERPSGGGYSPGTFQWDEAITGPGFNFPGLNLPGWEGGPEYEPIADFVSPGPFKPPTYDDLDQDPAYRFRVNEGLDAIERSAAARGTLLTGGTLKDLTKYGQDYASAELDKIYDRSSKEYDREYARQWNEWQSEYQINRDENQMAWDRSLAKYQTGVDALFKSYQANYQNARDTYSFDQQDRMTRYNAARDQFNQQESARASAAAADRAEQDRIDAFLEQMAGFEFPGGY